ncbi:hypothetical protein [Ruminococcus sp.]|uniref:hypothetical protein n=1 Tax=Ruminococcus sp. TaxID=41978 RepID=UPI0025FCAE0E|nr:hypothetical protein [Ruminococcus sp.]MCR4639275.1 hypothetical protein [Ruminococcus sp.]
MKKHFSLKKMTAFLMSTALIAGAMPVNAGGLFNVSSGITADAASEKKTPAAGVFYKVGDTISVTGDTWFVIDDDPNSGFPSAKISSDIAITAYESSDTDNQYIWKTGDTMFTEVHNGFYITRKDPSVTPEGFYITGGKGTENEPFIIGLSVPKFSGKNITLSDGIGMNFIVSEVNEENADSFKVKLSGDCAEADNALHSLELKTIGGKDVYCVTANISANNMDSKITAELYYSDSKTIVDTLAFSANDYLDAIDSSDNAKLNALVKATRQFGKVSEAYFSGSTLPAVADHSDDILNAVTVFGEYSFNKYQPMFDSNAALMSLVLDSKLAVRLYTAKYEESQHNIAAFDMWTFDEDNKLVISPFAEIYAFEGANGKFCFEVPGITPTQLGTTFNVNYQGTDYLFSPMSWAFRIMSKEDADKKDIAMANALYEYFIAATDYVE